MDIYLPADFYALRENLHDWRDAATPAEPVQPQPCPTDERNDCADPDWRVL
ncbi:MAG TPA: hypothetical protein VHW73_09420 [Rudaea sp.]|jgi:hypothetical protein|nr:hypothetical protein [Rudaea sp.]